MDAEEDTVDINTASVEEFVTRLKGVGRSKAKAIVRFRTTVGKFKKLCELTDVPGITQCILERNQGVLLCVSGSSNNLVTLDDSSDSESPLEEGDLSESSLLSPGVNEGGGSIRVDGQHLEHRQTDWTTRRSISLGNVNAADSHAEESLTLETPSTSIHALNDQAVEEHSDTIHDTPVMPSSRSRTRSKNDEVPFSITTRSRPAVSAGTVPDKLGKSKPMSKAESSGTESVGDAVDEMTLSPQAGPSMSTRGQLARAKKATPVSGRDRVSTRRKFDILRSVDTPEDSPKESSGSEGDSRWRVSDAGDSQMEYDDVILSKAIADKHHLSSSGKLLMKRKLDSRLDTRKLQSPEKKMCKSISSFAPSSNVDTPTFAEFKATARGILSASDNSQHDSKGKDVSISKKSLPPGSPRRFSTEVSVTSPTGPRSGAKVDGLVDWLFKFQKWNHADRIVALDELIDACEPRQVRHMLEVIEPQFQRDFISLLPKELALHVLSFLDPNDLLTAAQTCRYWYILSEDNLLWREKCQEEGIREPYYPKVCKSSWKSKRISGPNGASLQHSAWKSAFIRQQKIEMNWRSGQHKSAKLLKGHDDHVITCLQFSGTRIVSGSDDNTLKVWSAISGKCLRTLTGHTGGVWASQMRKNMIISGSTDRTLKIWNADTGQCIHTLYGHTSTVRCMALHDNIVVSGSRDTTLRVWDIDTGECLHVLTGHVAAVRCVCYDGKLVVSGAYDYMVKVWDPVKEECLHTLQGHTNRVYSLQFDGVHVVSGSLDTSIRVWSVETGSCLHTLVGHQSLTSGMELKNNILVSGNADSTVKMWDIITGNCLKTLEGPNKHQSAVTCLQFYGKFVITSSDDGTVKLWDVKTGQAVRDLVSLDSRGSGGVVWRIRASQTKLVCAVGSRNGTEETKLLVLDFDPDSKA